MPDRFVRWLIAVLIGQAAFGIVGQLVAARVNFWLGMAIWFVGGIWFLRRMYLRAVLDGMQAESARFTSAPLPPEHE